MNIMEIIKHILLYYVVPILYLCVSFRYKFINTGTVIVIYFVACNAISDLDFVCNMFLEHITNSNPSSTYPINHFVEIQEDDMDLIEPPKMEESSTQKDDNNYFLVSTMLQVGAIVLFAILRSL